jgi:hypothetical protein
MTIITNFDSLEWLEIAESTTKITDVSNLIAIPMLMNLGYSLERACSLRHRAYISIGECIHDSLNEYLINEKGRGDNSALLKPLTQSDTLHLFERFERLNYWDIQHEFEGFYLVNRWTFVR